MKTKVKLKPTIDSFTLRIQKTENIVIDTKMTEKYRIVYESGEIDESGEGELKSAKPYKAKTERTIIKFSRGALKGIEYIVITITAKNLGKRYFEGITKENIQIVYEEIIKTGIIKCTIEEFINGEVHDIDICKNMYIEEKGEEQKEFEESIKKIKILGEKNDTKGKEGIRIKNEMEHKAIYFSWRDSQNIAKPFSKIYHKEIELNTKSKEFKNKYLKEYEIKNLVRAETTIKNYAARKRLEKKGIIKNFKTLKELIMITNEEWEEVIKYNFEQWLNKNIKIKVMEERELKPIETMLKKAMQIIIEMDIYNSEETKEILIEEIRYKNIQVQKNTRGRMKKKIDTMINIICGEDKEFEQIIRTEKTVKYMLNQLNVEL